MTTQLDKTISHAATMPFIGDKGDDEYVFDIMPGQELTSVKLEMLEGRYRAGTRLASSPHLAASGPGQKIKVHWWFDGGNPPGLIKYRIRAFTRAINLNNAIVCAIENTRAVPMPDLVGLPMELRVAIEAFVSDMAEMYEEANCLSLFSGYYDHVVILRDANCTKTKVRESILANATNVRVDVTFVGHGSDKSIMMHGGDSLTNDDIAAWKASRAFGNNKLGLVYMMNCKGGTLNKFWLDLGFKASIGPKGNNWMPEPMFANFWARYRNGECASQAAQNSWIKAKEIWAAIYLPSAKLVRTGSMPWDTSIVWKEHENISSSKPVVMGDGELKISAQL